MRSTHEELGAMVDKAQRLCIEAQSQRNEAQRGKADALKCAEELQTVRTLRDETIERLDQEIERLTGGGADALKAYLNGVAYRERIEELEGELELWKRAEHKWADRNNETLVVLRDTEKELAQAQKKVDDLLNYVEMVRGDLEQAGKELTGAHEVMRESLSWGDISKSRDVLQDYLEALSDTPNEGVEIRTMTLTELDEEIGHSPEQPEPVADVECPNQTTTPIRVCCMCKVSGVGDVPLVWYEEEWQCVRCGMKAMADPPKCTPEQPTEVVADVECETCGGDREVVVQERTGDGRGGLVRYLSCPDCTEKPTEENTNG